jgi:phosphoribosylformylglycinamidine cyclo-ligase
MLKKTSAGSGKKYESAGVKFVADSVGFKALLASLKQTFDFPPLGVGRPVLDFGLFANVVGLGAGLPALAISTDGIGTKALVAQLLNRYDTVGIDCVAMNANDVICVGAEPIAMTDYIAVDAASDKLFAELGVGLLEGARQAGISIPGGEISQIPRIIKGSRAGFSFDLVGTCVGLVDPDRIIVGDDIRDGDVIVGLASSGIHCNGLTLAIQALVESARLGRYVSEFGRSAEEELLEPTRIYVGAAMRMMREELPIKALIHITSDGFLNLPRVTSDTSFVIDYLPDRPAVFDLVQKIGDVSNEEMFTVFNMGVGFCVVVAPDFVQRVQEIARAEDCQSWRLGHCIEDPARKVFLNPVGLVGRGHEFQAI